jgi:hypothetical protein
LELVGLRRGGGYPLSHNFQDATTRLQILLCFYTEGICRPSRVWIALHHRRPRGEACHYQFN